MKADPLSPRLTPAFQEYAQARGFHVDPVNLSPAADIIETDAPMGLDGTALTGARVAALRRGAALKKVAL